MPRPLPAVSDKTWIKSPIDAFILAGLEAKSPKEIARPPSQFTTDKFDVFGPPAEDTTDTTGGAAGTGTTGVGVIINMPVSVCHQVSMTGQWSWPIWW